MSITILIMGSSGMIGSEILQKALTLKEISRIILINKKPTTIKNKKIKEIIHDDFLDFSRIESQLKKIEIVFYCIGTYTGAVSREKFRTITVSILKALSKSIKKASPQVHFCLLSAAGADQSEKSNVMFAKDKGAAENIIINEKYDQHYFFRPGYIYPSTKRKEPNFMYLLFRKVYPLLKKIMPQATITSKELAYSMLKVGLKKYSTTILNNEEMKKSLK